MIDLPLPRLDYGEYAVVAKVYNKDPDHKAGEFVPSHCYVGELAYGLRPVRMRFSDVLAVYDGIGNPLAEDAIKNQVRAGIIVTEDESGVLYSVREVNSRPVLFALPGQRSNK